MSIVATIPLPAEIALLKDNEGRIVLTRDGMAVAALVPVADLRTLEAFDDLEDAHWSRVADAAIERWTEEGRPEGITHEEMLARYGIVPDAP